MGTLYLVATPIGNLEDITARALRVLREVTLIAAEDTRHTGNLLRHFGIATSLVSYHAFNARSRRDALIAALEQGDVALVSDAGSPGISDPGHELVLHASAAGFPVSVIPGPAAMVAALTASGLVPGPFTMLGFLPRQGDARRTILARAVATSWPFVLYESPHRIAATLRDLADLLGERPAVVARELTKLHEEFHRGTLDSLAADFAAHPRRGEMVIVVGGSAVAANAVIGGNAPVGAVNPTIADTDALIATLLRSGLPVSKVAREAAAVTGLPRSEVYDRARQLRHDAAPNEITKRDAPGRARDGDTA